jgi:gustatory receptor
MFLCASTIHENSIKPLKIIRSIPNEGWDQEIERFDDQIRNEVSALSGMKFFHLTRKVLFALASTILTYVLVLLQYNTTEAERSAWLNCAK